MASYQKWHHTKNGIIPKMASYQKWHHTKMASYQNGIIPKWHHTKILLLPIPKWHFGMKMAFPYENVPSGNPACVHKRSETNTRTYFTIECTFLSVFEKSGSGKKFGVFFRNVSWL
jgi:hypothetical protein